MNKITKDSYFLQVLNCLTLLNLFDITGDKMELLLDFPTIGEPHYAQVIRQSDKISKNQEYL